MDVTSYLDRLNAEAGGEPALDQLALLHERHLEEVPFENLDIHRGVEIILDENRILQKIVDDRRGGFCYELNCAFAWLLRELGYQVTLFSAEVARKEGGFGIPFDHMILGVELDQVWLADVGFGDSFRRPLPLVAGQIEEQLGDGFRLRRQEPWWILERRQDLGGDLLPQYRFTLEPRQLSDFIPGCRYHQTSPESTFTQGTICSRALPDGRVTLHPDRLGIMRNGERTETSIRDQEEWARALEEHFGMTLKGGR